MPYITASIITQLLRVVIPRFEALYKEGASGQATLTQYTRYLTIALGVLQSTTLIAVARQGALFGADCVLPILTDSSPISVTLMVITMTAGTGLIMWMGELITERGVGNGMSLLIFT
jgi:preprotein translocase subunit SecY